MRGRKKRKHLKFQNNKHLSLGVDIDMDEVVPMANRMLVGISLGASSKPPSLVTKVIVTKIPLPLIEYPLLVASEESQTITDDSLIRYNLRNRTVHNREAKGGNGLRLLPLVLSPKKRGTKSNFSLEKERERMDVASGKQSSIFWALRAKDAQEGVSP